MLNLRVIVLWLYRLKIILKWMKRSLSNANFPPLLNRVISSQKTVLLKSKWLKTVLCKNFWSQSKTVLFESQCCARQCCARPRCMSNRKCWNQSKPANARALLESWISGSRNHYISQDGRKIITNMLIRLVFKKFLQETSKYIFLTSWWIYM